MKIQTKLILLVAIVSLGFVVVASLSLTTLNEMSALNRGLRNGHNLIGKVWKLQSATQSLMISDSLPTAYAAWSGATEELLAMGDEFFANEAVARWATQQDAERNYSNAVHFFEEMNSQIDDFRQGYQRAENDGLAAGSGFFREVYINKNMRYLFLNNTATSLTAYLGETTEKVIVRLVELMEDGYEQLRRQMQIFYLAITIGIVAAITGFIIAFTRSIRRSFAGIETAMHAMSCGDFTQHLAIRGRDELAEVSSHINTFIDQFSDIIRKIKRTADETMVLRDELTASTDESAGAVENIADSINTIVTEVETLKDSIESSTQAVADISDGIGRLAEQIESQSSAVQESSSSVEEMTASIRNVARVAASKQEATDNLVAATRSGGEKVEATNQIVADITDSVSEMMEIIGIINKIASQTNMLSMNAAIEAAHAGDAGRGFSVVAEEIRNLSESTNTNAKKIRESLKRIRSRADEAHSFSNESRNAFKQIYGEVDGVTQALKEIASTMDELSVGTNEILTSTTELTETTSVISETSASIRERIGRIDSTMHQVRSFAEQVSDRTTSVEHAVRDITGSIGHVAQISHRSSESIAELSSAVNQFAVQGCEEENVPEETDLASEPSDIAEVGTIDDADENQRQPEETGLRQERERESIGAHRP